jgi:hypothetical protein
MELSLWAKPRKRLVREKSQALTVPQGINQVWSMDFMHDQLANSRTFRLFNVTTTTTEKPSAWRQTSRWPQSARFASSGKSSRGEESRRNLL